MVDEMMIREALDAAGYDHAPATLDALRECFMDYAAAGYFRDLDYLEAAENVENGSITPEMMIRALKGRK